jgi:hypothetical protein
VEQLSIFESPPRGATPAPIAAPPRARREDPITSQLAAAAAKDLAGEHYCAILDALDAGDGTIYELAQRTGLTHVQVARRMPELEKLRLVTTTDETRPSPSGRACRVWART